MSTVSLTAPQSLAVYANLSAALSKVQLMDSTPVSGDYTVVISAGAGRLFTANGAEGGAAFRARGPVP